MPKNSINILTSESPVEASFCVHKLLNQHYHVIQWVEIAKIISYKLHTKTRHHIIFVHFLIRMHTHIVVIVSEYRKGREIIGKVFPTAYLIRQRIICNAIFFDRKYS